MVATSHPDAEAHAQAEGSSQASALQIPVYEVGFHVSAQLGEDAVAAAMDRVRAALGSAEIIAEQFPAKIHLAYTIEIAHTGKREKHNDVYFGWIKFATQRESIPAIEDALRAMKDIVRHLLIETSREEIVVAPRRAVFTSDRLEGETLKKPAAAPEKGGQVSEEELEKSIEALVLE